MADSDELSPNLTTKNFIVIFVGTLSLVFLAVLTFALLNDGPYLERRISEANLYVAQEYAYVVLILSGVYILGIKISKLTWTEIGFRRCSIDWIVRAFLFAVLIYSARVILDQTMYVTFGVRRMLEPGETDRAILREASSMTAFALVTVMSILTPLATEIFQRGILFVWLRRNFNFLLSAIASAMIFGALHIELIRYAQALVFGVTAAYLYERSRSLWPPIVFHITINVAYIFSIMT